MIQAVSRYAEYRENRYLHQEGSRFVIDRATGEIVKEFPYPWPWFRRELEARLGHDPEVAVREQNFPVYVGGEVPVRPLFVSRMPRHKVTGAAHLQTVKSGKVFEEQGMLIVKRALTDLKLDKDGEIADYYRPQDDRLLYEALKERLKAFGGNGAKAFAEPFHKPKSDGAPGPLVRKVKLYEKSTLAVPILDGDGMANHDRMVRVDVFHVKGDGYYVVPIYVADTLKAELPNRAVVAQKPYSEWKEMREEDFLFSLYPNDLVRVTRKKPFELKITQLGSDLPDIVRSTSELLYYIGLDIDSAVAAFRSHDNSYSLPKLGLKTLDSIEKYTVDVLGNYYPVKNEKRLGFSGKGG
jgi:CRISPR-associated endonuclease Csn1